MHLHLVVEAEGELREELHQRVVVGHLRDIGEMWAKYRGDVGEMCARYGRDVGEIWARHGEI